MTEIVSLSETLSLSTTSKNLSYTHVQELHNNLKESEEALKYLQHERGLSIETIDHFQLGYDTERKAISIPLFKNGEVVAIKYRYLSNEDKRYDYEKGGKNWIYNEEGINIARNKGYVVIVEGEFDCMSSYQAGIKNVVSPASGKDSYGVWIELLDTIPRVYIAYDNDDSGKATAIKMSERLGTEKCFEISYPNDVKDASEYFNKYTIEDFKAIAKKSTPFYKYEFTGIADVIDSLRNNTDETIELKAIPHVKFEKDWVAMISGVSNVGKTSFVLNIADELTQRGIPTLILPFERGVETVGKRFLQVKFNKTLDDFTKLGNQEWEEIIKSCIDTPTYFALPKRGDLLKTVVKSKRLFDTRVVIIDHLDYIIRNVQGNKETEIANTLQALKRIAEENKILFLIVTHIRKIESTGSQLKRKPTMEDLKGSSSLYQDPEVVVMLTKPEDNIAEVNVLKNKGDMINSRFGFDLRTGRLYPADEFGDFKMPNVPLPKEMNVQFK